jgi:hypothetical protein
MVKECRRSIECFSWIAPDGNSMIKAGNAVFTGWVCKSFLESGLIKPLQLLMRMRTFHLDKRGGVIQNREFIVPRD